MAATPDQLVKALSLSKVLGPSQLQEVQTLLKRHADSRSLARALIDRQLLTPYQVNQLLQGSGQDLVLGPYVIQQRLGDNALGQVFKARHQHMNRLVSLTVVREDLLAQPEAVPQFYQEVQAVSQLTHPHLVCAYDAGPIGKTHFFAQEYVEGIDLERLVQQSGPLPVGPAITFIRQATLGLQHAFERRLLHHDLRPVNLLVTRFPGQSDPTRGPEKTPQPTPQQLNESMLKVCNLGLTMLQPRPRQGAAPSAEGIYEFAAPESAQTARLFDVRSNLYSLGCVFYYILAGRVPFPGGDSSTKLRMHQSEEAVPLSALRADVPRPIEEVIRKLMAKRPESRFQTPAELAAALGVSPTASGHWPTATLKSEQTAIRRGSGGGGSGGAPPARTADLPSQLMQRMRTPLGLAVAGGVLLLLLILFVVLLIAMSGGGSDTRGEPPIRATPIQPLQYVKRASRDETILATLAANGLPSFQGPWHYIGPFDSAGTLEGFDRVYPPEKEIDLKKTYEGKGKLQVGWKAITKFQPGKAFDLKTIIPSSDRTCVYLLHEFNVSRPMPLVVSLGSDDSLQGWFNGQSVVAKKVGRGVAPDQDFVTLNLKEGPNRVLFKICNGEGGFGFYLMPRWPAALDSNFGASLARDFPQK